MEASGGAAATELELPGYTTVMRDLADVWLFTRARLRQTLADLTDEQMLWRQHSDGHSIGEYLYHIAGAEHYWASRMSGRHPSGTEFEGKLDGAVLYGFLREGEFPFGEADMTKAKAEAALAFTYERIKPVFEEPRPEQLTMPLISPMGDNVTGREGLIRLAQHAAYHTGQIWVVRLDPRFPPG